MPESIMAEISEQYRNTHENLLGLIDSLRARKSITPQNDFLRFASE